MCWDIVPRTLSPLYSYCRVFEIIQPKKKKVYGEGGKGGSRTLEEENLYWDSNFLEI